MRAQLLILACSVSQLAVVCLVAVSSGKLPCALDPAHCKGSWESEAALAAPPAGGRQAAFLSPRTPAAIPTVQVSLRATNPPSHPSCQVRRVCDADVEHVNCVNHEWCLRLQQVSLSVMACETVQMASAAQQEEPPTELHTLTDFFGMKHRVSNPAALRRRNARSAGLPSRGWRSCS